MNDAPQSSSPVHNRDAPVENLHLLGLLEYASNVIDSQLPLEPLLKLVATAVLSLLGADLCIIQLWEHDSLDNNAAGNLKVVSCIPTTAPLRDVQFQVVPFFWKTLATLSPAEQSTYIATQLLVLRDQQSLISLPLIAQNTPLGLIQVVLTRSQLSTDAALLLLQIIARHLALKIQQQHLQELLFQHDLLQKFFDALIWGNEQVPVEDLSRRAHTLEFDVMRLHVVALMEIHPNKEAGAFTLDERLALAQQVSERVSAFVKIKNPQSDSLFLLQEELLIGLIDVSQKRAADLLQTWFLELLNLLQRELDVLLFVSISTPLRGVGNYKKAYREAQKVLQVGRKLEYFPPHGGIVDAQSLGVYMWLADPADDMQAGLSSFVSPIQQNSLLQVVDKIAQYDAAKGGNLLETLYMYFRSDRQFARTAFRLGAAVNTVRARLEKINALSYPINVTEEDYDIHDLWTAIKMYRLIPS